MFDFFIENNLISKHQSGFRPGDSCINQRLSIALEIYRSVDDSLDVSAVFLDICKAQSSYIQIKAKWYIR